MTIPVCQYCLTAPEFAPGLCTVRRTERWVLFVSRCLRCQGPGVERRGHMTYKSSGHEKGSICSSG